MAFTTASNKQRANIAVIGAGWWSQGWHIPHLNRHPDVNLVAIVDTSPHPKSNINPNLESLTALTQRYQTATYSSVSDLLTDPLVGPTLDGVIVATPHTTHYTVGAQLLQFDHQRRRQQQKILHQPRPLHILMEKPMTTTSHSAKQLHNLVQELSLSYSNNNGDDNREYPLSYFMINNSANYRAQTKMARSLVEMGAIGRVRHITAFMASSLSYIFEDPLNTGWNVPTDGMHGNGFGWAQSSHILAWVYHVCPQLEPVSVFCDMIHSDVTGADVGHAASVRCRIADGSENSYDHDEERHNSNDDDARSKRDNNQVVISLSGTSLLPGSIHSDPGKQIRLKIFGTKGAIFYCGATNDVKSGRLELRRTNNHGVVEYPLQRDDDNHDDKNCDVFEFENVDSEGTGPESLQSLVQACLVGECYVGADSLNGLKTVQTLEAMYRSHHEQKIIEISHLT